MSGNLAARYIAGLPYDPSLGVSAYSRAPRLAAPTGTASLPGGALSLPIDATGQAVRVPAAGASVLGATTPPPPAALLGGSTASGVAGGGNDGLIAALLSGAGLLQYLPDAYNAVSDWLSPSVSGGDLPTPPEQLTPQQAYDAGGGDYAPDATVGPWGLPVVPFGGADFGYVPPGSSAWSPAGGQGVIWDPNGAAGQLGTTNGWTYPGDAGGGSAPAVDAAAVQGGGFSLPDGAVLSAADDPFTGSLGTAAGLDVATGLAGAGGGALGGWIASQAPWTKQGYGAVGAQAGSALGGVATGALIGSAAGPIGTAAGALAGALLGGWGGGAAGSQIGPLPTIGRNFSSIGTFDGSGALNWGNSGGDNGGSASDATSFADWFGGNLAQQAAAQGLQYNPNMAGAQIRVGAYDNFSRSGPSPAGGFFYTPDTGGTPEQYALRPADDFANSAYSPDQANAFTTNVLADLAARGVYTQQGAQQPGMDYWGASQGTPLGWYGAQGGQYDAIQNGGSDFNTLLGQRQGAVQGWQAGAPQRQFNTDTAIGYRDAAINAQIGPDGNPIFNTGPALALGADGLPQADGGA